MARPNKLVKFARIARTTRKSHLRRDWDIRHMATVQEIATFLTCDSLSAG